jgi:hypothetical protein
VNGINQRFRALKPVRKTLIVLSICTFLFVCGSCIFISFFEKPTIIIQPVAARPEQAAQALLSTKIPQNRPTTTAVIPEARPPAPADISTPMLTNTPKPTATPEPTAPPTPPRDLLAEKILSRFGSNTFDAAMEVYSVGGDVAVHISFEKNPQFAGKELRGITLLDYMELHAYMATYIILHDFQEAQSVTTRIIVEETPIYQTTSTRDRAYDFPSGEIDLNRSPEAESLSSSATAARMIHKFDTQLLSDELANVVSQPTEQDIANELGSWVSGVDIADVQLRDNTASVTLDLTEYVNLLFPSNERDSRSAQDLIEDQAKMNTINAIGSLMDRFPSLNAVKISIQLDETTYSEYRCTRDQFNQIGRDPFITAVTLEDNNNILARLHSVK